MGMKQPTKPMIALIGAGNMAQAIIGGLIQSGWQNTRILAANPGQAKLDALVEQFSIHGSIDNCQAAVAAQIVILAVKPQKLAEVCQQLSECDLSSKLLISVAAGYPTEKIIHHLGQSVALIRAMPNTPCLIGCGATGLYANTNVNAEQKRLAEQIFQSVGEVSWIEDEQLMNCVTAIAGSSPAYFFLMMEAMVKAAVDSGMAQQTAFNLVSQSMLGAASLARSQSDLPLAKLRANVTSSGGTTEAAIKSLQSAHFEDMIKLAVGASICRGKELAEI